MLHIAYAVAGCLALWLNRRDRRMLALTALIIASVFITPPDSSQAAFYIFCGVCEIFIAVVAKLLRASASDLIVDVCVLLVISHVMGYSLDGSDPLSPYRSIVKLLEASQLLACVALSPALAGLLRNHDATTT